MRNRLLLLLCVVLVVEGFSFVVGLNLQQKKILYKPVAYENYNEYRLCRDPVLGWPPVDISGTSGYDSFGARLSPAFADASGQQVWVSLYGNSFTWALEVDDEMAWGNQLALRMGCPVANYGVGGYGTDQAYLRFKQKADRAPVSILGIMTENIARNVMQFKDIIYPKEIYSLKPRFVLDEDDRLILVPLPDIPLIHYGEFVKNPEDFLEYDFFRPGGPSRVGHLSFPFSLTVSRVLRNLVWHQLINGGHVVDIVYKDFYRRDHPSRALQVTVGIAKAFAEDCLKTSSKPIVVIFPDRFSLDQYRQTGNWLYQTLSTELQKAGISVVDMGPPILDLLGTSDTTTLFKSKGHYNERVNSLVAEQVHAFLVQSELATENRVADVE